MKPRGLFALSLGCSSDEIDVITAYALSLDDPGATSLEVEACRVAAEAALMSALDRKVGEGRGANAG